MKIKFKIMTVAVLSAMIGLASCSKDSGEKTGGPDNNETTSVSLQLTKSVSSRAVGGAAKEEAVDFNSGYVIFTNNVGVINKVTTIAPGDYPSSPGQADQDAKEAGTKVWLGELESAGGSEIKNVPAAAQFVYIAGNLPTGSTVPAITMNISTFNSQLLSVFSQSNATGSVADVTLYGGGVQLSAHGTITGAKYAKVKVDAVASRLEISKISYESSTNLITGFQIDGIFVNHYYPEMSLSSEVSTELKNNAPADNTAADAMYMAAASGAYKTADNGTIYDYDTDGIGVKITDVSWKANATTGVWAYNVLAPKTFASPVTAITTPHIVVRLSDITTKDDVDDNDRVYKTTQYLTVKDFKLKGQSNPMGAFVPGYIYYITDLKFDESNLTDTPEAKPVTVYVEAELMEWKRAEVEWEF